MISILAVWEEKDPNVFKICLKINIFETVLVLDEKV